MSVFRVAMDAWAIGQVFPVLPLHRLEERPSVAATLADVTCDSDGKLCRFGHAGREGAGREDLAEEDEGRLFRRPAPFLRLHALREGEPYRLALALGGVYQEILGSSHNLFGRMHAVALGAGGPGMWAGLGGGEADAWGRLPGGCRILSIRRGETVAQVLKGVHYSAQDLLSNVHDVAQTQVSEGGLDIGDAEDLVQAYADCLRSYPYLSQGVRPQ
ncbi:hypothetical protein H632_c696p0 [Helicosporidium sp. ATCC 50920]|nr:hypothetical protein H632_c696p0 [Helicosporidium sp. ATCC 50920]|eukprot:KDD75411.1 hypothetical protein H632_c696p0 [Helicosporidium sp. ATCC 50920]